MMSSDNHLTDIPALIRAVEEEIVARDSGGLMRCPIHLSTGNELAVAGVVGALKPGDRAVGSHRCHAEYLAMGGNLQRMVDELHGLSSGCVGGKGGSMHLSDPSVGFMGTSAIVGSSISIALGLAWGMVLKGDGRAAVAFFGDAALETGQFWECLNMACLWRLPLIFVCTNNGLATATPIEYRQPQVPLFRRLGGWPILFQYADGRDWEGITAAGEICRNGLPSFLEIAVTREMAHVGTKREKDSVLNIDVPGGVRSEVSSAFDRAESAVKALEASMVAGA